MNVIYAFEHMPSGKFVCDKHSDTNSLALLTEDEIRVDKLGAGWSMTYAFNKQDVEQFMNIIRSNGVWWDCDCSFFEDSTDRKVRGDIVAVEFTRVAG